MRALPLLLLLALASGAAAQTDARLHGAWTLVSQVPDLNESEIEIVSVWMEFDASGRMFAQAHFRDGGTDIRNASLIDYTAEGDQIVAQGDPARLAFHQDGTMTISEDDGSKAVTFARADAIVLALDVLGDWQIASGPAEQVTFSLAQADDHGAPVGEPQEVRLYLHNRLFDSGVWSVGASGLTIETPGMGTVTYTGIARDGEHITLTGDGESLTLEPLATQ